jgi:hypothetical protein
VKILKSIAAGIAMAFLAFVLTILLQTALMVARLSREIGAAGSGGLGAVSAGIGVIPFAAAGLGFIGGVYLGWKMRRLPKRIRTSRKIGSAGSSKPAGPAGPAGSAGSAESAESVE